MVLPKRGGLVVLSNLADRCGIAAKYRNIMLRSSEDNGSGILSNPQKLSLRPQANVNVKEEVR
jgi:hypothetical protein